MVERAGKPNSVRTEVGVIIYLGRRSPDGSCTLPAAFVFDALLRRTHRGGPPLAAYLGLLAVGFTLPRPSPAARCALTTPFHPYQNTRRCRAGSLVAFSGRSGRPRRESQDGLQGIPCGIGEHSAVCFLWHYPSAHAGLALPTTVPCPVRTFLTRIIDGNAAVDPRAITFARSTGYMVRPIGRLVDARGSRHGNPEFL